MQMKNRLKRLRATFYLVNSYELNLTSCRVILITVRKLCFGMIATFRVFIIPNLPCLTYTSFGLSFIRKKKFLLIVYQLKGTQP